MMNPMMMTTILTTFPSSQGVEAMGEHASPSLVDLYRLRDPEAAIHELHDCIAAVNASMAALAKLFPGVTAMAGFIRGEPCTTLAFSSSREADHFTLGAMNATKSLARIAISLLPELQDVFAIELKYAAEERRLKAQIEAVTAAAIRAAGEGTHSG
jgi:hypothetical protein